MWCLGACMPSHNAMQGSNCPYLNSPSSAVQTKALELPKEHEMPARDKYTVFSPHEKGYRKGIHKVPKWTRVSTMLPPRTDKFSALTSSAAAYTTDEPERFLGSHYTLYASYTVLNAFHNQTLGSGIWTHRCDLSAFGVLPYYSSRSSAAKRVRYRRRTDAHPPLLGGGGMVILNPERKHCIVRMMFHSISAMRRPAVATDSESIHTFKHHTVQYENKRSWD